MKKKFTDLILIIGTSPLPNYIAVDYFMQSNKALKRVWMFCSEKNENQKSTEEYAKNLKTLIQQKNETIEFGEISYLPDINKKSIIEPEANKMLTKMKQKETTSAHLFYTGGTKSEVVHIYNSFNNQQLIEFSFSYLSARDFRIYFDDNTPTTADLRNLVKIKFVDLCKLHSFKLKEEQKENDFVDVTNEFDKIIQNEAITFFFDEDRGYNRKLFLDIKGDMSDKISKLKKENKELLKIFKPNQTFQEICDMFPEKYNLFPNGKFNEKLTGKQFKSIIKEYLDGKWFETYCRRVIKNSDLRYDELLINQEPFKGDNSNNNFELDILLMKGYQLAGISCTTSAQKHLCKSKGFEIILRTRQIGGTEAKAVLITKSTQINTQKLQNELILSTGTTNKNILVLGFNDWKKEILIEKLTNFLDWR